MRTAAFLLLVAFATMPSAHGASTCATPDNPLVCIVDADGDGVPDDAQVAAPTQVGNDLGTFDVLPVARVAADGDGDGLPDIVAADLVSKANTQDRDPGLHAGFEALDGDSAAAFDLGTGNSDLGAGIGADASDVNLDLGLDMVGGPWWTHVGGTPVDADGDGAADHVLLALAYHTPFEADAVEVLAPLA